MNGLSPWAVSASAELAEASEALYQKQARDFNFTVYCTIDSVWISVSMLKGGSMAFRAAYSPGATLRVNQLRESGTGCLLELSSEIGVFKVSVDINEDGSHPVLRYSTVLKPEKDLFIPFWPRDIIATGKNGNAKHISGKVHASQVGTRSGMIYMSMTKPKSASVLYLQNLTALGDYCQQTETSAGDTVGGSWPEMGFSLPPTTKEPLQAGKEISISDAFVAFDTALPADEAAMVRQYLDLLARVYLLLPKPQTVYQPWPDILDKGLKDLLENAGCMSQVGDNAYFNAYVSDYETPPEIMVQLAVLLPLLDYVEWSGNELDIMQTIKKGLPQFFDKDICTIMRWLPAAEGKLKGEEEQKLPKVMDSWYLHHPLLNLSRLALKGDGVAKDLFLGSIDYAIKVAKHFNYKWPVFYKMDTLEVLKAETAEGKGGEKDVAGLYAHVMIQAWELTGQRRFLNEAEKAAKTLVGYGFEIFYQANNTAFSAGALLRLYKITGNELYLNLSYMCLAGIFKNVQLWDCNYGYGKNLPTFFALFPLNDAPYTAVYEEQEVFCALHDYLKHSHDVDILTSVRLLIAEYIRFLVNRAAYYYPSMLPEEMLEKEAKVGEVNKNLWIALEDLHDGWEKSGAVGQEVYGAGNAFGILPRHYFQIPNEDFYVFVDYPTSGFNAGKKKKVNFKVLGDDQLTCRLMLVKKGKEKLPDLKVAYKGEKEPVKGKSVKGGNIAYELKGNSAIEISWQ
ncbi:hypothetical protein [Pedobacter hartonius]|uniref:Uncharacterized protein n=1 Tax=Pedobacter hartonius TaxID=425514 RepID=A0A1H4CM44_9SPHI|nr:hypothetical protein [Pedobacter hartonius]SEA61531.1 hypothetical protein SAMN05443550_104105 [Pedobacter hartonius]